MKLGQVVASALRTVALSLDAERALAERRHTEVMRGINAILSHMPGVMQTIETHTLDIDALKRARLNVAPNGKGTHQ
jgi:regulator of protease activity HflC (stomatin/prohibitin superfamily)